MKPVDYQLLSDEEVATYLATLSASAVKEEAIKLSPKQLHYLTLKASPSLVSSLFLGAQQKDQIEAIGKGLDLKHALPLLQEASQLEKDKHWKLLSLLVGLSHSVFLDLLAVASEDEIHLLQHEAMTEPVQHHLNSFVHDCEKELDFLTHKTENLEITIRQTPINTITTERFKGFVQQIEALSKECALVYERIKHALAIAWNTNRTDLIAKLTQVKEMTEKTDALMIGRQTNGKPATGLYKVLCDHFSEIYLKPESLDDQDPAIEALARLSLQYMSDYWEAGLLPFHKSQDGIDAEEKQEDLLKEVHATLRTLGLETVRDVKNHHIYSKEMFKAFIKSLKTPFGS